MKISKLLNKKNFLFFIFFIFFGNSIANEPVDIWNIDKTKTEAEQNSQNDLLVSEDGYVYKKTINGLKKNRCYL